MRRPVVLEKLCEACGMDPSEVVWHWERGEPDGDPYQARLRDTLTDGTGVILGKDPQGLEIGK